MVPCSKKWNELMSINFLKKIEKLMVNDLVRVSRGWNQIGNTFWDYLTFKIYRICCLYTSLFHSNFDIKISVLRTFSCIKKENWQTVILIKFLGDMTNIPKSSQKKLSLNYFISSDINSSIFHIKNSVKYLDGIVAGEASLSLLIS